MRPLAQRCWFSPGKVRSKSGMADKVALHLGAPRRSLGATAAVSRRRCRRWYGTTKLRSKMIVPTTKEAPTGCVAKSHELLYRGGFLRQSMAGVFHLLPLATRVLSKLEALIDRELQKEPLHAEKLQMPLISSGARWVRSGRWDAYGDELFRLEDRKGQQLCLGPTFEEEVTDLMVALYGVVPNSALPIKTYQISTKYRDEARPRYGLLRGREFVMKDLYSFHASQACAQDTYEQVVAAYTRIFGCLGLDVVKVLADSGAIGGSYTHEFQALASIGEDELAHCDTGDFRANTELIHPHLLEELREAFQASEQKGGKDESAEQSVPCQMENCSCRGAGKLFLTRGIEVGQTFLLGTKYSESFRAVSQGVDENGKATGRAPMEMGCYGIGVSRLMAAVVESARGSDQAGIIWPPVIAPFDAVVMTGPGNKADRIVMMEGVEKLHKSIGARRQQVDEELDVVIDDRFNDSFGKKLSEAKLIGYPQIVIFGKAYAKAGNGPRLVEVIDRATLESRLVPEDQVLLTLQISKASALALATGTITDASL